MFLFWAIYSGNCIQAQDTFDEKEKEAINSIIEDYIMSNPEVILKSVEDMRSRERERELADAAQNLALYKKDLFENPTDPVGGNVSGDVTIVEFFDYRCGYCKRFKKTLDEVLKEDDGIRLIYKEFPVLGPDSKLAASAALAATRQGRYIDFHDKLMSMTGKLDEKTILSAAGELGLDVDQLQRDMKLRGVQGILDDNTDLAHKLTIRGTPGVIIGSEIIRGAVGLEQLKDYIARARE